MYQSLEVFRTAGAMAAHATARQSVISRNMANADTPGYRRLDIAPFSDLADIGRLAQVATRPGHMNGQVAGQGDTLRQVPLGEAAPNGNGVSLEDEMRAAVAVKMEHDRALAIYRSAMTILRSSLGRR